MKSEIKQMQKKYESLVNRFDPWTEQIVIETVNGERVIELSEVEFSTSGTDKREFTLCGIGFEEVTGMESINQKVNEMIASGEVVNVYIDSL